MTRKKRSEIIITARDAALLQGIAGKPTTLSDIRNRYFNSNGKPLSSSTVSKRITRLVKFKYLNKIFEGSRFLISVGEVGSKYLIEKHNFKPTDIKILKKKSTAIAKVNLAPNKKLYITPRDVAIIDVLTCGPATFMTLRRNFFRTSDGKPCSTAVACRRLQKLVAVGYIKKVMYPTHPSVIYYLGDLGAEYLTLNFTNYRIERIRMNIVNRNEIAHELMVTEVIRAIKKEEDKALYRVKYLYDDSQQRKESLLGKGKILSDINMSIELPAGPDKYTSVTYNIEIDTGKCPIKKLISKLYRYPNNILIITPTINRRGAIQKVIMGLRNNETLKLKTFLALSSDVMSFGFVGCKRWKSPDKMPAEIV